MLSDGLYLSKGLSDLALPGSVWLDYVDFSWKVILICASCDVRYLDSLYLVVEQ